MAMWSGREEDRRKGEREKEMEEEIDRENILWNKVGLMSSIPSV